MTKTKSKPRSKVKDRVREVILGATKIKDGFTFLTDDFVWQLTTTSLKCRPNNGLPHKTWHTAVKFKINKRLPDVRDLHRFVLFAFGFGSGAEFGLWAASLGARDLSQVLLTH